jgi:hypothetical protein
MNLLMTQNLFPLPTWAPALQRVPAPLVALNEAFVHGTREAEPGGGKLCIRRRFWIRQACPAAKLERKR